MRAAAQRSVISKLVSDAPGAVIRLSAIEPPEPTLCGSSAHILGDGIETTRTLRYVPFKPTRLPKTLGPSFGGLNESEPHVPAFRTDRSSSGHPSKRIFEAQPSKRRNE